MPVPFLAHKRCDMKNNFLILPLVLMTIGTNAQETEALIQKRQPGKNEIGIFVNPLENDIYGYEVPFGLQYKRWTTPNLGYRIMVGIAGYSDEYRSTEMIRNDTFYWALTSTNMSMIFVGGGLEMQRRFIGKSYLYAAVEFKGGYGKGYTHTSQVKETAKVSAWERSYTYEQTAVSSITTSVFTLDTTPFIGAKLNFRRWVIGTELAALVAGAMSIKENKGYNYSTLNVDFGQLQQRLYINYRF